MKKPIITVLMTVYNGESYLTEAIESILYQSYADFEFLIIDDASTDSSNKIILSYKDDKIRYVRNDYNIGQTASLNYGLNIANGKYIARMDQDDLSHKDRIQTQIKYLINNKNIIVVGSWANSIDENGVHNYEIIHPTKPDQIKESITCGCPLSHSSVMFEKDRIIQLGGYPSKFKYAMDWGLWMECIKNDFRIANIPKRLVSIRTHSRNATSQKSLDITKISEQYHLIMNSESITVKPIVRRYSNGLKILLGLKLLYFFIIKLDFKQSIKIARKILNNNVLYIFPVIYNKAFLRILPTYSKSFQIEPIVKK